MEFSRIKLCLILLLTFGIGYIESSKAGDLFQKYKSKLKNGGKNLEKCNIAVKNGQKPSAEKGHSPLDQFGIPSFNEQAKTMTLAPGATLSNIGGTNQPIKLGARDYIIAGSAAELLAFFECFKDYEIIGSTLDMDGKWKPEKGSLKIQIQNLFTEAQGMHSKMWEITFKITLDSLTQILAPKTLGLNAADSITGLKDLATGEDIRENLVKIKQYLPDPEPYAKKLAELIAAKLPESDKIKKFQQWIEAEEKKKALKPKWSNTKNVDKGKKIVVMLTMYEKPDNAVRATYHMGKAKMKVSEIGDAIAAYLA